MKTAEEEVDVALRLSTWQMRKLELIQIIERRELTAKRAGMIEAATGLKDRIETLATLGDEQTYSVAIHELKARLENILAAAQNLTLEKV